MTLLALTTVGSVLAVGSVHPPVAITASFMGVVSGAVALAWRSGTRLGPALICMGLSVFCVIQAVPLPAGWIARLAPDNADIWARSLRPFGDGGPAWIPISVDPGASLLEALKWCGYAGVFCAAAAISAKRGPRWVASLIFGSAVVTALVTISHGLAGAGRVYGLYEPAASFGRWNIGPLLNRNNLAGYLNLGALAGLGLLLARGTAVPRWIVGAGVAAIIGVAGVSASRGGLIALPLGIVILVACVQRVAKRSPRDVVADRRALLGLPIGVALAGAGLALLASTQGTLREALDQSTDKLSMLRWIRPMAADHITLGIGRGAFGSVSSAYRIADRDLNFAYAENFVAQWVVEWGAPVAVLSLLAFGWMLRPRNLGAWRHPACAAALAGACALFAHNFVDLALEVPAVSLALAASLGGAWGAAAGSKDPGPRRRVGAALLAFGASLLVLSVATALPGLAAQREQTSSAFAGLNPKSGPEVDAFFERLRVAMTRHPAEPYFARLGAQAALRSRKRDPMVWVQRALERDISNGRNHLVLAEVLARRGARRQALLELRYAMEHHPDLIPISERQALVLTRDPAELRRAVPDGIAGARVLHDFAVGLGTEARLELAREACQRDPLSTSACPLLGRSLLDAIGGGRAPCTGGGKKRCTDELDTTIRDLERLSPALPAATELAAMRMLSNGAEREALEFLSKRCQQFDAASCFRLQLTTALQVRELSAAAVAAKDAIRVGCATPPACASLMMWIADKFAGAGHLELALTHYDRACRMGDSSECWLKEAGVASRLGLHARAIDALERARTLTRTPDAALEKRIVDERAKLLVDVGTSVK